MSDKDINFNKLNFKRLIIILLSPCFFASLQLLEPVSYTLASELKTSQLKKKQVIVDQLIKDIHFLDLDDNPILPIWQKKKVSYQVGAVGKNADQLIAHTRKLFDKFSKLTKIKFYEVSTDRADITLRFVSKLTYRTNFLNSVSSMTLCKRHSRKKWAQCTRHIPLNAGKIFVSSKKEEIKANACLLSHIPKLEIVNYMMRVNIEKGLPENVIANAFNLVDTTDTLPIQKDFFVPLYPKDRKTAFSIEHFTVPGNDVRVEHFKKFFPEVLSEFDAHWLKLVEQCAYQSIGVQTVLPKIWQENIEPINGHDKTPQYTFQHHCRSIGISNIPRVFGCHEKSHAEKMQQYRDEIVRQIYSK
ncbi:MAG: hypothetical protein ABJN57_14130 [Hyphomicrobiales bacterium]